MAVNPVLIINVKDNAVLKIRARIRDEYSEHEIIINSILTYYWANKLPSVVKFLELFDSVIKRSINEIMPHKTLNLKYNVKADDTLEQANEFEIKIINIEADGINFKIENPEFKLTGFNNNPNVNKTPFNSTFEQSIDTPDIVLKKYKEMKN